MKTLYLDCRMGAAGDMLFSALFELIDKKEDFLGNFCNIGIPNLDVKIDTILKNGIKGTKTSFYFNGAMETNTNIHSHHHNTLLNITHIVNSLNISDKIKNDVINVYNIIAKAESIVHNKPVKEIHFHEIGALDAVADITGVCMLMDILSPDIIMSSPVCVGYGQVQCAHKILPVPAPATALILQNTPIFAGNIEGELCTPTGAGLISYFTNEYSNMPLMANYRIGYGMGAKEFEALNCLRAFYSDNGIVESPITKLDCNIDDMTAEDLAFATKLLLDNGALDVFTTPIYMKKNRPGILLSCICNDEDASLLSDLIFKHTSTLGIRKNNISRYTLERENHNIETKYGKINIKKSFGHNTEKIKIEHDDLERIAIKYNMPIEEIRKSITEEILKGL